MAQCNKPLACCIAIVGLLGIAVLSFVVFRPLALKEPPPECTIKAPTFANGSFEIVLETFEGVNSSYPEWRQQNDPVMGGSSKGTFTVDKSNGVGVMEGEVADVKFLQAPGFIKAEGSRVAPQTPYPDITGCKALAITAKASNDYAGFRWSIGRKKAEGGKRFAFGYKTNWYPAVGEFTTQVFALECFSNYWDDATGNAIKTCTEDSRFCIDEDTKKNPERLEVWAEGVKGKVRLEVREIKAVGCSVVEGTLFRA